jgi:choline dehydrogenase-like flavoprotein
MASYTEADVLVIGAGAGGGVMSKRLSDAGISVVCLEQGDWVHPMEHPHMTSEWEIEKRRGWSHDPNLRKLPADYPSTGDNPPLMYNAVGGSAIIYAGAWPRFKPVDFRRGTEHGVEGTIDWPISYEDLEPYYAINDDEIGVARRPGDPGNPPRHPGWGPAIAPGKVGNRLAGAFDKLGWHWWPADHAVLTRAKDGRLPCNNCGACLAGCPRNSIATTDVTYWPKALHNGVDLRTGARVEVINTANGRATGATYIERATGARHEVRAKIVVLAANGVGTPRLLLMSAQKGHPDGLANSSGLVGTHLMYHAWAFEDFWFDEPIEGYKAHEAAVLYSQEFYHSDPSRGFVNGFSIQVGRSSGPAHTALGTNSGNIAPWGEGHRDFFDNHFGSHLLVYIQGEDLPIRSNRVTLDDSVTDSDGLPGVHVEYRLHENDRRLLEFGRQRAREAADAAGGLIDASSSGNGGKDFPQPGWHLMGTARMGNSPENSVINKFNQAWDVPNLFITDGSAMATAGAVNPTSTLQAIAVRCAEYIKSNHAAILQQRSTPQNSELPAG